ncbi:MAG: HlyD family type I secretion periplasmic adaptor subunit [Gammaproteobacteria bacterium]
MNLQRHKHTYKYLPQAARLEEVAKLTSLQYILVGISIFILILLLWASLTSIDEIARTQGQLLPNSQVNTIKHLEGGIVKKILVRNGQTVTAGELLIQLDPTTAQAELQQLRAKQIAYLFDSARLRHYLNDQTINFEQWSKDFITNTDEKHISKAELKKLLNSQDLYLHIQHQQREDKLAVQQAKITKLRLQLNEITQKMTFLTNHASLVEQEFKMYSSLEKDSYVSKRDLLRTQRELNKSRSDLAEANNKYQQLSQELTENLALLHEIKSNLHQDAVSELTKINAELLQIQKLIRKYQDIVERTDIKAPINGVVKGLELLPGSVITPHETLCEIVPDNDVLYAEARISPLDIGHIKVGDSANIKILTYDFARYGTIPGTVTAISATTFFDKQHPNQPYYLATISLNRQYVEKNHHAFTLKTGMSIQADIKTGRKTILQYWLKPVHTTLTDALHER